MSKSKSDTLNQKLLERQKKRAKNAQVITKSSITQQDSEVTIVKSVATQPTAAIKIVEEKPTTLSPQTLMHQRNPSSSTVKGLSQQEQLDKLHIWIILSVFTIIFITMHCCAKSSAKRSRRDPIPDSTNEADVGDVHDAVEHIVDLAEHLEHDPQAHFLLCHILVVIHDKLDYGEWIQNSDELKALVTTLKDCTRKVNRFRNKIKDKCRRLSNYMLQQKDYLLSEEENLTEVERNLWSLLRTIFESQLDAHLRGHLMLLQNLDTSPPLLIEGLEGVAQPNFARQVSIGQQQQQIQLIWNQSAQQGESSCKNDLKRLQDQRFDLRKQISERSQKLHWIHRGAFTVAFSLFVLSAVLRLSECTHSKQLVDFAMCILSHATQRTCSVLQSSCCEANGENLKAVNFPSSSSLTMSWDPVLSFTMPMLNYLHVMISGIMGSYMNHTFCAILVGIRVLPSILITLFFNLIWLPAIGSYLSWLALILAFADVIQHILIGPMWPTLIITCAHLLLYWIGLITVDWKDWSTWQLSLMYFIYTLVLFLLPWAWYLLSIVLATSTQSMR